jgi:O-antigen/teichoic acid export membrane protein
MLRYAANFSHDSCPPLRFQRSQKVGNQSREGQTYRLELRRESGVAQSLRWPASRVKAGIHNTVGGLIRTAISVGTVPVIVRLIGLDEYGLWALVSAILGIVLLAEGGLSVSTTVFVAQDLTKPNQSELAQTLTVTIGAMGTLATGAALVLWFSADSISNLFPTLSFEQRTDADSTLRVSALAVWFRLMQQIPAGVEQACHRYGILNILTTVQQALSNLGLLGVAWFGGRALAFMQWQALVGALALAAHAVVALRLLRPWRLRPVWNTARVREIGRYSVMTWTSALGTLLFSQCDRLVIAAILNTASLGVYSAIANITTQINVISALPVQPLVPLVSQMKAAGELLTSERKRQLREAFQMNVTLALMAGSGLYVLAPEVVRLFVPGSGSESVLLFRLATVIYALYSLNAAGYYILLGASSVGTCMKIVFCVGFLAVLAIAGGSFWLGLPGGIAGNLAYIGTLGLTVLGFKQVGISAAEWSKWIRFPMIWSVVLILACYFIGDALVLRVLLLVLGLGILGKWWVSDIRRLPE